MTDDLKNAANFTFIGQVENDGFPYAVLTAPSVEAIATSPYFVNVVFGLAALDQEVVADDYEVVAVEPVDGKILDQEYPAAEAGQGYFIVQHKMLTPELEA